MFKSIKLFYNKYQDIIEISKASFGCILLTILLIIGYGK